MRRFGPIEYDKSGVWHDRLYSIIFTLIDAHATVPMGGGGDAPFIARLRQGQGELLWEKSYPAADFNRRRMFWDLIRATIRLAGPGARWDAASKCIIDERPTGRCVAERLAQRDTGVNFKVRLRVGRQVVHGCDAWAREDGHPDRWIWGVYGVYVMHGGAKSKSDAVNAIMDAIRAWWITAGPQWLAEARAAPDG